jgi:hypothetical protein
MGLLRGESLVSIFDSAFDFPFISQKEFYKYAYPLYQIPKEKPMKVEIKYKEVEKPIESVTLTLTPEEVEYIRYWASLTAQRYATATACNAANRLDKLLPKTGVGYHPEKCFL